MAAWQDGHQPMHAEIVIESREGGAVVATIHTDRLEMMNARGVQTELNASLKNSPPLTVLDLTQVQFIDSSGIGILVSLHKLIHAFGGKLVLVGLSTQAKGVLKITKMEELFAAYTTVEEALQHI